MNLKFSRLIIQCRTLTHLSSPQPDSPLFITLIYTPFSPQKLSRWLLKQNYSLLKSTVFCEKKSFHKCQKLPQVSRFFSSIRLFSQISVFENLLENVSRKSLFCKFIQMNGNVRGFEITEDCLFFPHTNLMIFIFSHRITFFQRNKQAAKSSSIDFKSDSNWKFLDFSSPLLSFSFVVKSDYLFSL